MRDNTILRNIMTILLGVAFIAAIDLRVALAAPSDQPLLQQADLVYQGAFKLPTGTFGSNYGFIYVGRGLAYNPAHNSLFMESHIYDQMTAEISIPELVISNSRSNLNTASVLQNFADITEGHLSEAGKSGAGSIYIGGLMAYGTKLIGTAYVYYDVAGYAVSSHFSSGQTLSTMGDFKGMDKMGDMDPGYYAGYMTQIPPEWQGALGGPALTGQSCVPGPYRTSMGPAAFVFNPDDLGVKNPVPATPLLYYSQAHPTLGTWEGNGQPNPLYNMGTTISGVVFPQGTRSVLYSGYTGLGTPCYGCGGSTNPGGDCTEWCYDPDNSSKGTHAYPYSAFVWAYDANDLVAVKNGQKNPWDIVPYASWTTGFPDGGYRVVGAIK
jgi:hypothetical protein